jgi:hypothetical protein
MHHMSDPRMIAERMLMADGILSALSNGTMPMHALGYLELATWAHHSFAGMTSGALRALRDAAPDELKGIAENVLHGRGVITWAADQAVGLSAMAESLALIGRCRR